MARRFVIAAFGIVSLAVLAVASVRNVAVSADDAAGKKNGDVVSRLETRIAALEKRIANLERQRDRGETRFLAQPLHRMIPGPVNPNSQPPQDFDGNWCYTILIDGNGKTAQIQTPQTQR
jgi:hypothetical protein